MRESGLMTVRELRRRWRPRRESLLESEPHQPMLIRVHRCLSWMNEVERILGERGESATDTALIYRWIAFNALYGVWDSQARLPIGDRECIEGFCSKLLEVDAEGSVESVLRAQRRRAMDLFRDDYLTEHFWREPTRTRSNRKSREAILAKDWYATNQVKRVLHPLLERIYFLRCQLVHGAASYGGKLNRTAVRRCAVMLGHLLEAFVLVLMDHGWDEEWGALCYPPLHGRDALE